MLFIIATYVFQKLIEGANSILHSPLTAKLEEGILALQYADDTAIIANSRQGTLITLKLLLRVFTKISGLSINFSKNSFVQLNLNGEETEVARVILGFQKTTMPVTYLGMPLTIGMPNRQCYLPLIENIERRIEGWKGKLISRGGRLQLVKSILLVMPIYFMSCFKLPIWVLQRIDGIRRVFLWGKSDTYKRGVSLIN